MMKSATIVWLKKRLIESTFACCAAVLMMSCNNNNNALARVEHERDSIAQVAAEKDSSLHQFVAVLSGIEKDLVSIREKEERLNAHAQKTAELRKKVQDEINTDIRAIADLMQANSQKIMELNRKLKEAHAHEDILNTIISSLAIQLYYKSKDIQSLNKVLDAKQNIILNLDWTNLALADLAAAKTDSIKQMTSQASQAYYLFATAAKLKERNIIDKKGVLNTELKQEDFKPLDIRQKTIIPAGWRMETKHLRLLTVHPESSYEVLKNDKGMITNIRINDPVKFWKVSKYLVAQVDDGK